MCTELVSRKELANRLGCSERTVTNWVSKHGLPYVRKGKRVWFIIERVLEWAADKRFISVDQIERVRGLNVEQSQ